MRSLVTIAVGGLALIAVAAAHADSQLPQGNGGHPYTPEINPNDVGFGMWSRINGNVIMLPAGNHTEQPRDQVERNIDGRTGG
jgi:hypothetical protein